MIAKKVLLNYAEHTVIKGKITEGKRKLKTTGRYWIILQVKKPKFNFFAVSGCEYEYKVI